MVSTVDMITAPTASDEGKGVIMGMKIIRYRSSVGKEF